MKAPLLISSLLLSCSAFAQHDSLAYGGDTVRFEILQKSQNASNQRFDKLMITPPQKLYLPLESQSPPLTLYIPTYGSSKHLSPMQSADNQRVNNFYFNQNVPHVQLPKPGTSDKIFGILGVSATAFVWGMVVKQAVDGKPNPNAPPQKRAKPQGK